MCLAKAYVSGDDKREVLLEDIASLKVKAGKLLMTTLFGEQKEIEANIAEIDFMASSVVLENVKD